MGRKFTLTDAESSRVVIADGLWNADINSHNLYLVGGLLASKQPRFDALSTSLISMATIIGNSLGRFRDMEMDGTSRAWGTTLRFRVSLDVMAPLKHGFEDPSDHTPYGPWLYAPVPTRTPIRTQKPMSLSNSHNRDMPKPARGKEIFGNFELSKGSETSPLSQTARKERIISDPAIANLVSTQPSEISWQAAPHPYNVILETQILETATLHLDPDTRSHPTHPAQLIHARQPHGHRGRQDLYASQLYNRKRGRLVSIVDFDVDVMEASKRRHLLDEGFDTISAETVRTLNKLIRLYNPALVVLSETKCRKRKCEYLKEKYNMYGVNVDARGKSGGFILLWRKHTNLVIQSFSSAHIDANIASETKEAGWRFTGIYGQPDVAHRGKSWELLRQLSRLSSQSWLCAGDFNEIA
ncbi:UNVERIFIED_CONTAM: hypothetical protein Sradi_3414000 [Sesamum radiatum]|uniref:Endonuclease/exonuclease/phosphatase domain-containing protein n=1 Tax=Sesamum radiatum TaxID=300843 RepID=A0AAW2R4S0_SESRA